MVGTRAAGATGNGRKTPLGQELDRIWKGFGKDLTLDLNTPGHRSAGAADIEDACGEYRRPLSFQLGLCSELPLEVYGER